MPDYSKLIARALAAAGLGGAATVAAPDEAQASFIGRLARNFNVRGARQAQAMSSAGASPDTIHALTGMSRPPGPFQGWRQEIPDYGSTFRFDPKYRIGANEEAAFANATPMQNWFRHPQLFKNYPELTNIPVMSFEEGNIPGTSAFVQHQPSGRMIMGVNRDLSPEEARSSFLHELTHAVQKIEGWPRGGDFSAPEVVAEAARNLGVPSNMANYATLNRSAQGQRALEDAYLRLAGEVEARNVQKRAEMTLPEMEHLPPWMTQAVPYSEQISRPPGEYQSNLPLPYGPIRKPFTDRPSASEQNSQEIQQILQDIFGKRSVPPGF